MNKHSLFVWLFIIGGIISLVLALRWHSGPMTFLGGAFLLRAGWEIGRYLAPTWPQRDKLENHR